MCALEFAPAGDSTSDVGRMPPAAGSVMSRPVAHPPTKTMSSRNRPNTLATDSSSCRFGSAMVSKPGDQFLRGKLPLPGTTIA